jgi:hypothetical protein
VRVLTEGLAVRFGFGFVARRPVAFAAGRRLVGLAARAGLRRWTGFRAFFADFCADRRRAAFVRRGRLGLALALGDCRDRARFLAAIYRPPAPLVDLGSLSTG